MVSRLKRSSWGSLFGVGYLAREALLLKKENRLAIAGFGKTCDVDFLCTIGVGRTADIGPIPSRGSDFSFVGDGTSPTFIGADSPVNQLAILLGLASEFG